MPDSFYLEHLHELIFLSEPIKIEPYLLGRSEYLILTFTGGRKFVISSNHNDETSWLDYSTEDPRIDRYK